MSGETPLKTIRRARAQSRIAEREVNRASRLREKVTEYREAVELGRDIDPTPIFDAFDRLGAPSDGTRGATLEEVDREEALAYLTETTLERANETEDYFTHFKTTNTISEPVWDFLSAFETYVEGGGDWKRVTAAFEAVVTPPAETSPADHLEDLRTLERAFEVATTAAELDRESRIEQLDGELKADHLADDPVSDLTEQPVALFPVRMETRFVGSDDTNTEELRIRLYPDQIHVDSHDPRLTEDEFAWAKTFWAHVWYASHETLDSAVLGRLPSDRLQTAIEDFDPEKFSTDPSDRYAEVKERAWKQLLERFGRERAAWLVHSSAPEDPPSWGSNEGVSFSDVLLMGPDDENGASTGFFSRSLPGLTFPEVEIQSESHATPSHARLLPDRWTVRLNWIDENGDERTEKLTGEPIREPLPVGPAAVGPTQTGIDGVLPDEAEVPPEDGGSSEIAGVPPGMEWLVDFDEAEEAGMALRVDLEDLEEFDSRREFTSVIASGVKSSMAPDDGPRAVAELLDAHHYTDGLSVVPQGTPTNEHDVSSGYGSASNPAESVAVECGPPLVSSMDFTDGDLLARTLGIDMGERTDHVFAHVADADSTEQRDARHANSALWPATIGYYLQHMLVPNADVGEDGDGASESITNLRPWLEAYRRHFIRYVRARGPLPAFRAGKQPYGVLPVTAVMDEHETTEFVGIGTGVDDAQSAGFVLENALSAGYFGKSSALPTAESDGDTTDAGETVASDDRYASRFDPGTNGIVSASPGSNAGLSGSDVGLSESDVGLPESEMEFPGYEGEFPIPDMEIPEVSIDGHIDHHLGEFLRAIQGIWSGAAEELPWTTDDDLRTLLEVLQREAVSSDLHRQEHLHSAPVFYDSLVEPFPTTGGAADAFPVFWYWADSIWNLLNADVVRRKSAFSDALGENVLQNFDPRIGNLLLANVTSEASWEWLYYNAGFHTRPLDESFNRLTRELFQPRTGTIPPEKLVDADTPSFIQTLVSEPFETLERLDNPFFTRLNLTSEDGTDGWTDRWENDHIPRPHPDSGLELDDSVLGLVLRYGALNEYRAGRTRLGVLYDDLPSVVYDPATFDTGDDTAFEDIYDDVPDALATHAQAETDVEYTYADVLFESAQADGSEIPLDPRMSEFTDSLEYLAGLDVSTLESLLMETFDLAGHRLDAWWTSIATKRLFELREQQARTQENTGNADDQSGTQPDSDVIGATDSDPGLYVGCYGFVENLSPDSSDGDSEYLHAPSQQQATTAAMLRGAHKSNATLDDGFEELLSVELTPQRVRSARRLIDGVRDGQSLGELLGYRFERRLHENDHDLARYKDAFRELFPSVKTLNREGDEGSDGGGEGEDADQPARPPQSAVVDGYALVRAWNADEAADQFETDELADVSDEDWSRLESIVDDLQERVDAVRDLLTAENVHQIGQGNFERAGASLDALAKAERVPESTVARTPRSKTGVTHRQLLLFPNPDDAVVSAEWDVSTEISVPSLADPEPSTATADDSALIDTRSETTTLQARRDAEPVLDSWVGELLCPPDDVECVAEYRWQEQTAEDGEPTNRAVQTTVTLDALSLSPLDALYLSETEDGSGAGELETYFTYHLLRNRPEHDPPIPHDATVECFFDETERQAVVSVADFVELARSIRDVVTTARPADGRDLAHPIERPTDGYTADTAERLSNRANRAQDGLEAVCDALDRRLAVVDPEGGRGVTEQVERVVARATEFDDAVPLSTLAETSNGVDADTLIRELKGLTRQLPAGPTRPRDADADVFVTRAPDQPIRGSIDVEAATDSLSAEDSTDEYEEATLQVWSRSPSTWFERSTEVAVSGGGSFVASLDFESVELGTGFEIALLLDGRVAYSATGRVVAEEPSDERETWSAGKNVRRLLWLSELRDQLAIGAGESDDPSPATRLHEALSTTDWDALDRERATMTSDMTPLSPADREKIDALFELSNADLAMLERRLEAVLSVPAALGLIDLFELVGDRNTPTEPSVWANTSADVSRIRPRLERVADAPDLLNEEFPSELLGYDPEFAVLVAELDDPVRFSRCLDAFLNHPGWVLEHLANYLDSPHEFLKTFTAWAYHPEVFKRRSIPDYFAHELAEFADVMEDMDRLEDLFDGVAGEESNRTTFAEDLRELADVAIDAETPTFAPRRDPADPFLETYPEATAELAKSASNEATRIDGIRGGDEDVGDDGGNGQVTRAFRIGVLEPLRTALLRASYYGVDGAVPTSSISGTASAESALVSQAHGVSERADARLEDARSLDPREAASSSRPGSHGQTDDGPPLQRVEDSRTRIRALFGGAFVTLPPFEPSDCTELHRTFTNDGLLEDGDPLTVETWLQRAAAVRDRPAGFREALSYSELLTGALRRDLQVGQLPHREDDDWVGLADQPDPGRVSLVTQFGAGADPSLFGPDTSSPASGSNNGNTTAVTGLFVDEWVETVPAETETTGVALNHDAPDTHAPQSVLLSPPPASGGWSSGSLEAVIAETLEFTKLRAVDLGDMPAVQHLLPALTFADNSKRDVPSVDFDDLGADYHLPPQADLSEWGLSLTENGLDFDDDGGEDS